MREIVLDTETTGLNPFDGHRIVEIGAVELMNHMPTGKTYHQYINPQRDMPQEAFEVHGINSEFLSDKPIFRDIAQAFLDFCGTARLVIHNASFDMKFINAELDWLQRPGIPMQQALDTLLIARKRFPGAPASLDALCRRFGIDNSARQKHGALLDSEILAEVYLELIGGRQPDLVLSDRPEAQRKGEPEPSDWRPAPRQPRLPARITASEKAAHAAFLDTLGGDILWRKFDSSDA